MRRRSDTVLVGAEATSTTVVKPECVSIACMSRDKSVADLVASPSHWGPVKWTWAFQKPAKTVQLLHANSNVPAGTRMLLPTALIFPACIRIVVWVRGGLLGET